MFILVIIRMLRLDLHSFKLMGTASVIDGDTLEIHGQRIRLYGIDAPESDQLCKENGQRYRCGQKAALALSGFIGRRTVSCRQRDTDHYGRAVALCSVAGQDLGGWLVSNGHGLAYRNALSTMLPRKRLLHMLGSGQGTLTRRGSGGGDD
jgi:endonuclease YncB( thermonuclease family)